ncbi:unnamed protein product [Eruca vesicaria subsp. sativa]|uniref:F-box associated beta-propeller type 1 domain-containing protein n=1 Tax=Eruca vesicaria subsp. sativa TaxID=29727 RepID=A0ABC8JDV3_ERUVS|nr:unnamed protein product [Eruca vesicaria subsp. sativa]
MNNRRPRRKQISRKTLIFRVGKRMSDLGVGEKILTKVPAVVSTCEAITKSSWVMGKEAEEAAPHEFVGFMMMNAKVYSLRYNIGEDLVDVKQVDFLNQLDISEVYHCDGLVLCVPFDHSKLVVWNPYMCQTRWIGPRLGGENFNIRDTYAIGYNSDDKQQRDHKILRFVEDYSAPGPGPTTHVFRSEIYEISSDSWRVLEPKPMWEIEIDQHQRGVSLKGNTYFFAHEQYDNCASDFQDFLLCFDFTKEKFGPRLPLPFHSHIEDCVTLSNVRDEQLAVLFGDFESTFFEIWVTLTLEQAPDNLSWNKFLRVETTALTSLFRLDTYLGGSFFVDEENKVAVVFELDEYLSTFTPHQNKAFVFGQAGYIHSVDLAQVTYIPLLCPDSGEPFQGFVPPLVCSSSYRPSLVQVKQPLLCTKGNATSSSMGNG